MTKKQVYEQLIEKFGAENQILKCVEELNELGQVLCKLKSKSENKALVIKNIIEEIADVEIMLEQIKLILGIEESDVKKMKSYKLHRTVRRYGIIDERGNVL